MRSGGPLPASAAVGRRVDARRGRREGAARAVL